MYQFEFGKKKKINAIKEPTYASALLGSQDRGPRDCPPLGFCNIEFAENLPVF